VWDVGHQTYVHKILTAAAGAMGRLRQAGGPSGFPAAARANTTPSAPPFVDVDLGGAGHGGRRAAQGEARKVVAVIGDGAMSAAWRSRRSTMPAPPASTCW